MKKLISLVLVLMMALSLVPAAVAEAKEPVHLVTISAGSKPAGYDAVMEAANAYSAEKYGITIEVRFLDWDPKTTYPIIMNTGDGVDMVWYSSWPGSPDYARQGAFMELEDYLELPEYADLKNAISETAWNDVKIDGHIYCIPAPETTYAANNGIIYRSDLCEKLNLPVPNTVENAVAYLEGVKATYPDVNPLCTAFTRGYDFARLEQVVWAPGTVNYGLVPVGSADNLVNYYASDAQLEDYKLIRSLVEKGIVSRDLQNDTVAADEKLKAGTAMMEIGHLDNFIGRYSALENAKAEDPSKADWTLDLIPFNVAQGYVLQDAATTVNATGISFAYPDHIKESLTYIQAVLTDPTLHHLIRYGIEGVHYELDENGNYVNLSEDFGPCGLSTWNWRSDALSLEGGNSAGDVKRREILDQYKACEALTCAFTFDRTSVEDEVSNFQLVVDQYLKPLQYGLVEDVEAGLQTFRDKAEEAGVSKIQEEYTRQYTEWLANNK